MNNLQISVVVPVYNGAAFLREALESISGQSYAALEIIVVDDGSTDDTRAVVQAFAAQSPIPVRYVFQENRGQAAARNTGIRLAQGQWLAFLDADDIWMPEKLKIQAAFFADPNLCDLALGRARFFRRTLRADGIGFDEEMSEHSGFLGFQAVLCRRSAFEKVGLINEALRLGEDTEWFFRAREAGLAIVYHPEVVLLYRRHPDNLTVGQFGNAANMLPLLRQSLARRRQQG